MVTNNGTLLAMIEARKYSCDDEGYVDLRMRRSFDNGKTWEHSVLIHGDSEDKGPWTTVGDGNFVQDPIDDTIYLLHTRNNSRLFLSFSKDDGATFSEPKDVSSSLKFGFPNQGWVGTGHAGGIVLSGDGPKKGRLVIPTYTSSPYIVYSDDHGVNWKMGGAVPGETYLEGGSAGEWAISETGSYTSDGTPILLANVRNSPTIPSGITGKGHRLLSYSEDGGETWGPIREVKDLPEPIKGCEGSMVYNPKTKKIYFSHPDPYLDLFRNYLKVWSSSDHGKTWQVHKEVWNNAAGYSSMVVMPGGDELGVFYDRNNHTMIVFEAQSVSWTTFDA
jgi:sialidase-1